MEDRKLEVYTFNIHAKRKIGEKAILNNINGTDIYLKMKKDLANFINELAPLYIDQKTCRIETVGTGKNLKSILKFSDQNRYIAGKIAIGEDDGKEQDVVKNNKKKDKLYTKSIGESIERPFYFIIVCPLENNTGYIAIEREGKHSIKSVLTKIIKLFINNLFGNLDVKFKNFIEDDIIRMYLEQGDYNSIILSRNVLAKEKSQQLLSAYQEKGEYKISFTIAPKGKTKIPILTKKKIISALDNNIGFFECEEFENLGFDKDSNIKIISTLNNNTKTIDLSDTFKARPYYIIETKITSKGFSDFDSIHEQAIKLFKDFNLNIL
ncbi:hypothetical protein HX071_17245 [Myroides marinus]|uniref:hypothetical protein n=1 Tax=Myroides marinus TaxID=703342 RepID=UPI0025763359|nr:hypothetical protein [Myroides marinus]MDM1503927.1 hypothetical protein [Myroides marinus]